MIDTIELAKKCGAEEIEIVGRNFECSEPNYFVYSFLPEDLETFRESCIK